MIVTSLQNLRDYGFLDRYLKVVHPKDRDALFSLVPGVWVDGALILAHYQTCDRIGLTPPEIIELGRQNARRLQNALLSVILRAAGAAGVSPWLLTRHLPSMWGRSYRGGGIESHRVGEREARVEILGFPPASVAYSRIAWRGVLQGGLELLDKRVRVGELTGFCTHDSLGYRVSWE